MKRHLWSNYEDRPYGVTLCGIEGREVIAGRVEHVDANAAREAGVDQHDQWQDQPQQQVASDDAECHPAHLAKPRYAR